MTIALALLLLLLLSISDTLASSVCPDDCANVTNPVVCFDHTHSCGSGVPGQFAYFAFSQLYLPQYCSALSRGYDPTARDPSRRCSPRQPVSTLLSIHGLWPNYIGGYPQCCSHAVPFSNETSVAGSFDPRADPQLFAQLEAFWIDPAAADGPNSVCGQMWNHEYLKHATCMLRPLDPVWFLNTTLAMNAFLQAHTAGVERIRQKHNGTLIDAKSVRSMYAKRIQIVCDPSTKSPQLVELRTCWSVSSTTGEPGWQIDCSPDAHECPSQFFM
jgi:ribonuclease T2